LPYGLNETDTIQAQRASLDAPTATPVTRGKDFDARPSGPPPKRPVSLAPGVLGPFGACVYPANAAEEGEQGGRRASHHVA
jgi:hypothetical protein